jgi:histone H3/H4
MPKKISKKGRANPKRIWAKKSPLSKQALLAGFPKIGLRKIALKAGIVRLSSGCYDEMRSILGYMIHSILRKAIIVTEHSKRLTVT